MTSSTASALRHPQNLADLLDGRPDTRELISGNLNLAHACLLLKQGEPAEAEHALELAQQSESPGLSTISRCIRAEVLRVNGRLAEAWDLAEELSMELFQAHELIEAAWQTLEKITEQCPEGLYEED